MNLSLHLLACVLQEIAMSYKPNFSASQMALHQCVTLRRVFKMICTCTYVKMNWLSIYLSIDFELKSLLFQEDLNAAALLKVATTRLAWLCSDALHTDYSIIFTFLNLSPAPMWHTTRHGGSLRLGAAEAANNGWRWNWSKISLVGRLFSLMYLSAGFRHPRLNKQCRFINV